MFAAMLAFSDLSDEQIVRQMEECYRILKPQFMSGNAVQSLSHVLALCDGTAQEKCGKTMDLYDGLHKRGCRYGTSYELATLGVLAMLPESRERIMDEVLEVDAFLAGQKGYGIFGLGKKQRLMHAAMLVSANYVKAPESVAMHSAAIGGTISMIAAQQAAMCAAIAASAAAASSASSSGN